MELDKSKLVLVRKNDELLCVGKFDGEDECHVFIKPLAGVVTAVFSKEEITIANK